MDPVLADPDAGVRRQVAIALGEFDAQVDDRVVVLASVYLAKTEIDTLVIDLTAVTFMDSSGVSQLVQAKNTADEKIADCESCR